MRFIFESQEELVINDGNIGFFQARCRENIDNPFRFDVVIHQIPDRLIQIVLFLFFHPVSVS